MSYKNECQGSPNFTNFTTCERFNSCDLDANKRCTLGPIAMTTPRSHMSAVTAMQEASIDPRLSRLYARAPWFPNDFSVHLRELTSNVYSYNSTILKGTDASEMRIDKNYQVCLNMLPFAGNCFVLGRCFCIGVFTRQTRKRPS